MPSDQDYFDQFAGSDLPTPIDASAPGEFRFDTLTIFALGNDRYVVSLSKDFAGEVWATGDYEGLLNYLRKALGDGFILTQGSTAAYTPLGQSAGLKRLIHQIVQEELRSVIGK